MDQRAIVTCGPVSGTPGSLSQRDSDVIQFGWGLRSYRDRSIASGPLEKRSGTLGTLLRCMNSSSHLQTRDSAGEFLWALSDDDGEPFGPCHETPKR